MDFKPPDGYKKIPTQLVFDCKHDFKRKARLVAGGHRTVLQKIPPTAVLCLYVA